MGVLPESTLTELQIQVLRQFRLIFGSVRQHFREVEASCGISGSQVWLLRDIDASPGVGVSQLAKQLSIHQSTCSLLVEKLVAAGLVSKARSARDQRRVGLETTPAGRRKLELVPDPAEGILPEALRQLPDVALRTLQVNLDQLICHLTIRNDSDANKPLADL
jgi:DNA-binding MarR family transcriptional regulator